MIHNEVIRKVYESSNNTHFKIINFQPVKCILICQKTKRTIFYHWIKTVIEIQPLLSHFQIGQNLVL